MDFKVKIECCNCKCVFELRPHDFKVRESLECPNCGQAFPANHYEDLKSGVSTLGRIPEHISEDDNNPYTENLFTVQVKSYGILHSLYGDSDN